MSDDIQALVIPCGTRACQTPGDLTLYNLQDALYFNGVPISILADCPAGYVCTPGVFPVLFTYPVGRFTTTIPQLGTGFPVVISIQGCQSDLTTILPPTATAAEAQAAADVLIQEAAQQQAFCDSIPLTSGPIPVHISLSTIASTVCHGDLFSATIGASATPSSAPYSMILSPTPAWMTVVGTPTSLLLSGIPDPIGVYSFTVAATSSSASGTRNYSISVVGIATASPLPVATKDSAYSQFLDALSIPGVLTWSVSGGALPTGLALDTLTGEIFGTPTIEETSNFTVSVSNGEVSCSKEFNLTVTLIVFEAFTWTGVPGTSLGQIADGGFLIVDLLTLPVIGQFLLSCPSAPVGYNVKIELEQNWDNFFNGLMGAGFGAFFTNDWVPFTLGPPPLLANGTRSIPASTQIYACIDGGATVVPTVNTMKITVTIVP